MRFVFPFFFYFQLAISLSLAFKEETCRDADPDCSAHENRCFKQRFRPYSFMHCRRTCRLCVPPGYGNYFLRPRHNVTTSHFVKPTTDRAPRTRHVRSADHIKSDKPATPNSPGDTNKCGDLGPDCLLYTNFCTNQYYLEFMMDHCPLSCGYCPTTFAASPDSGSGPTGPDGVIGGEGRECSDVVQECGELARIGFCESDEQPTAIKRTLCAKTCKLCVVRGNLSGVDEVVEEIEESFVTTSTPPPTTTTTTTTTPEPPPTPPTRFVPVIYPARSVRGLAGILHRPCFDSYRDCRSLIQGSLKGFCDHRAGAMLCRRACGYCSAAGGGAEGKKNALGILPTRIPVTLPGHTTLVFGPGGGVYGGGGGGRRGLVVGSRKAVGKHQSGELDDSLLDSLDSDLLGSDSLESLGSEEGESDVDEDSSELESSSAVKESSEEGEEDSLEAEIRRLERKLCFQEAPSGKNTSREATTHGPTSIKQPSQTQQGKKDKPAASGLAAEMSKSNTNSVETGIEVVVDGKSYSISGIHADLRSLFGLKDTSTEAKSAVTKGQRAVNPGERETNKGPNPIVKPQFGLEQHGKASPHPRRGSVGFDEDDAEDSREPEQQLDPVEGSGNGDGWLEEDTDGAAAGRAVSAERREKRDADPAEEVGSEFTGDEVKIHVSTTGRIELGAKDGDFRLIDKSAVVPWQLPKHRNGTTG